MSKKKSPGILIYGVLFLIFGIELLLYGAIHSALLIFMIPGLISFLLVIFIFLCKHRFLILTCLSFLLLMYVIWAVIEFGSAFIGPPSKPGIITIVISIISFFFLLSAIIFFNLSKVEKQFRRDDIDYYSD